MSEKIKVIVKRPDEKIGHITWMSNNLENFQKAVGGYIETVAFGEMIIICDEEGRIKGKEPNCRIGRVDFVGTIIAVGSDGEEFADVPMDIAGWKFLLK